MLRAALFRRMRHSWQGLGRPVQIQIALGALGLPALLADHAQRFYVAGEGGREALVPWIVRVVVVLVFLFGVLLARVARTFFLTANDETFLSSTPLSRAERFRHRAFQLALAGLPAVWLGAGAVLPLLWNGDFGLFAAGMALWIAWAGLAWAFIAASAALLPPPGRGQALFELVQGAVPALLLWAARPLTGLWIDLARRESLWGTAALGALVCVALAVLSPRSTALLARRDRTLEHQRSHDSHASAKARHRARKRGRRFGQGPMALAVRNLVLAMRTPRVAGPWAAGLLLKVAGFAAVLAPADGASGVVWPAGSAAPWALAGALLLFGDALIAGALIAQMEWEDPEGFFGAPVSRKARWWVQSGPALVVTALSAIGLAAVALLRPEEGFATARFILVWCGLAGLSLLVTATNLALASYPEVGVAQNLFWVGLLVCLILSAVIPLFGWVVLVAFAAFSFRQLRHWGPA